MLMKMAEGKCKVLLLYLDKYLNFMMIYNNKRFHCSTNILGNPARYG